MRFLRARFTGYIGFYNGLGLDTVDIDFSNARNTICIIAGPNGVGKSTLASALSLLPDGNECFRNGVNVKKELTVIAGNIFYGVIIEHPWNKTSDSRGTPIAHITKNGVELNISGKVSQYKETIFSEFAIDGNFMEMSKISSENRGMADKKPAERKKLIASKIESLSIYNEIYKELNKKASIFKSHMNGISYKLQGIGNQTVLQNQLEAARLSKDRIEMDIKRAERKFAAAEAIVERLDKDGVLQREYTGMAAELESLNEEISSKQSETDSLLNYFYTCKDINVDESKVSSYNIGNLLSTFAIIKENADGRINTTEKVNAVLDANRAATSSTLNTNSIKLKELSMKLEELKRSDYYNKTNQLEATLQAMVADMGQLANTYHFKPEIMDSSVSAEEISLLIAALPNLEAAYESLEIKDGISNEYLTLMDMSEKYRHTIEVDKEKLETYREMKARAEAKRDTLHTDIFEGIEVSCPSTSCKLLEKFESMKDAEKGIEADIEEASIEIEFLSSEIKKYSDMLENQENIRRQQNQQKEFSKLLSPYIPILRKINLPYELAESYNEDIQIAKTLIKYKTEIYEYHNYLVESIKLNVKIQTVERALEASRQESTVYEVYQNQVDSLEKENEVLRDTIRKTQIELATNMEMMDSLIAHLRRVEKTQEHLNAMKTIYERRESLKQKMEKNSESSEEIKKQCEVMTRTKSFIEAKQNDMKEADNHIRFLEGKSFMLDSLLSEFNAYKEKYDYVNVLRKYSSPTQGSIQSIYMSMYMNSTLDLTNQLLRMLFNGQYQLLDYVINENEFRIPFIGNGLVVDDISSGSTSQKCMMGMIINLVLFHSASSIYNIPSIDEMDSGLDQSNRMMFGQLGIKLSEILEFDQMFMISHSIASAMNNIDVILLSDDQVYREQFKNANIIYQYSGR